MINKRVIHNKFVIWIGHGSMEEGIKILKTKEHASIFDLYHDFIIDQIQNIILEYMKIVKKIEKYGLTLNTRNNSETGELEIIFSRPIWDYCHLGSGNSFFSALHESIKTELQEVSNTQIYKDSSVTEKAQVIDALTTLSIRLQEIIG